MVTIEAKSFEEGLMKVIEFLALEIETEANNLLIEHGNVDTGELINSSEIIKAPKSVSVKWSAEHTSYVEYGSDPHYPPFEPIFRWVKRKLGVGDKEAEAIAYGIINKIGKYGQEPKPFIIPAIYKVVDKYK